MTTLPLIDKDITKIVGLQGYRIKEVRRIKGGHEVEVELPDKAACPVCGEETGAVHQRGQKPSRLLWGFIGGERRG